MLSSEGEHTVDGRRLRRIQTRKPHHKKDCETHVPNNKQDSFSLSQTLTAVLRQLKSDGEHSMWHYVALQTVVDWYRRMMVLLHTSTRRYNSRMVLLQS